VKPADEIRAFTARNELHPLVAQNLASPRGLCNAGLITYGAVFCTRDYDGVHVEHVNDGVCWSAPWPPRVHP
jgi:hypothetical protein